MTEDAIRDGFARLRPGEELEGLAEAAQARALTDWLIGMNATRALTKRLKGRREKGAWSAGRVQTPTLALLVERELEVLAHDAKGYWRLVGTFEFGGQSYTGTWFDPAIDESAGDDVKDDRIFEEPRANAIVAATTGRPGSADETRKPSRETAPPLFDLTSLQREAIRRFGWTARRTLSAAQRCYEAHKILTYPRTDSRCLPNDYREKVRRGVPHLRGRRSRARPSKDVDPIAEYGAAAQRLLDAGLENEARTFDDTKVSDHFAIIPTGRVPGRERLGRRPPDLRPRGAALPRQLPPAGRVGARGANDRRRGRALPHARAHDHGAGLALDRRRGRRRRGRVVAAAADSGFVRGGRRRRRDEQRRSDRRADQAAAAHHRGAPALADGERRQGSRGRGLRGRHARARARHAGDARRDHREPDRQGLRGAPRPRDPPDRQGHPPDRHPAPRAHRPPHLCRADRRDGAPPQSGRARPAPGRATSWPRSRRTRARSSSAPRPSSTKTSTRRTSRLGPCPTCGRPVVEAPWFYRCQEKPERDPDCPLRIWKDTSGRYIDRGSAATLVRDGKTGALEGFTARNGRTYQAHARDRSRGLAGEDPPGGLGRGHGSRGAGVRGEYRAARPRARSKRSARWSSRRPISSASGS